MEQPFTAYHPKPDGKGALVGNWVDERELHSLTETSRYEELTPAAFTENSVYPTQVKMKQAPTFKRVFEHTDNLAADSLVENMNFLEKVLDGSERKMMRLE